MTATTYTTIGPVRECCGHEHRTEEAALRCISRDQTGCRRQGGYSDRSIYSRTAEQRARGRAYLTAGGDPAGKYGSRPVNATGPA